MRAVSKIYYRYYNDGDVFFYGYGVETIGSHYAFITTCEEIPEIVRFFFKTELKQHVDESGKVDEKKYTLSMCRMMEISVGYIEISGLASTNQDCTKFQPAYTFEDEAVDECFSCGYPEEDCECCEDCGFPNCFGECQEEDEE